MIFIGQGSLLMRALKKAAASDHEVDKIFSGDTHIQSFCEHQRIPIESTQGLNEEPSRLHKACSDGIVFSIDNTLILQPSLLEKDGVTFWGIHNGIIPHQRGNPVVAIIFAILRGDSEYGASLFQLDAGIDTGEVAAISRFAVAPTARFSDVLVQGAGACDQLFCTHLDEIVGHRCRTEAIHLGDTKTYGIKDLKRLSEYREHPSLQRAIDFGGLAASFPKEVSLIKRYLAEETSVASPTAEPAAEPKQQPRAVESVGSRIRQHLLRYLGG